MKCFRLLILFGLVSRKVNATGNLKIPKIDIQIGNAIRSLLPSKRRGGFGVYAIGDLLFGDIGDGLDDPGDIWLLHP